MTFSLTITTAEDVAEATRAGLLSDLAAIRWQCQSDGVSLPGGVQIPGDEVTRGALSGAVSSLDKGMITEPVTWKTPAGFVDLSKSDVEAAAQALAQHVQACFAAEHAVTVQIAALSANEVAGFDVEAAFAAAMAG